MRQPHSAIRLAAAGQLLMAATGQIPLTANTVRHSATTVSVLNIQAGQCGNPGPGGTAPEKRGDTCY